MTQIDELMKAATRLNDLIAQAIYAEIEVEVHVTTCDLGARHTYVVLLGAVAKPELDE